MLQISHLTITHRKDLRTILSDFNGKSTLLKWIFDPALIDSYADAEGVRTAPGELLGYLPQELPEADARKTVYEYFSAQHGFRQANAAELARTASALRFEESLFYAGQTMASLSGGERVKLQLAGLLLAHPDHLLLDEPSNDIDIGTLEQLEKLIREFSGGVLFISHDETLIERTANRVVLLEQLRRKSLPRVTVANLPFAVFMEERKNAFARQEQEAFSERREEKKAMERFRRIEQAVEQDLRSISRQNPSGGRLLKKKMKSVKSLEKRFEREHEEMTELPEAESAITIKFERQKAMPAGKRVLDLTLPRLEAPSGRLLAENISLQIRGPEKIGLIGANGAGKTTLLRLIAEQLAARSDLTACYMSQNYEETLPFEKTPVDYLAPSGSKEEVTTVRTYLGALKYTADEMYHPIRELSGGQKA